MKRLESWVDNSLESSMASLMETMGGMSVQKRSSKTARRRIARSTLAIRSNFQFWEYFLMVVSISGIFSRAPRMSFSAKE